MRTFSIKELETFSSVKAHTIRTWEKRYAILNASRHNGIRVYSITDLKMLLNIALLVENGIRISELADLQSHDIEVKTNNLLTEQSRTNKAIYSLIVFMFTRDIETFESALDSCILTWGINETIDKVIIPFLEKTNILSYSDSSSEVHFVVTVVRKKLILGIENLRSETSKASALLFLPKGEHYDLLLLYLTYVVKQAGVRVLYLGTNIPADVLEHISKEKKPDYLFTYLSPKSAFTFDRFTSFLRVNLPKSRLFITSPLELVAPDHSQNNVSYINFKKVNEALSITP
jgi:DNA-binding transcriptional MerR regulator